MDEHISLSCCLSSSSSPPAFAAATGTFLEASPNLNLRFFPPLVLPPVPALVPLLFLLNRNPTCTKLPMNHHNHVRDSLAAASFDPSIGSSILCAIEMFTPPESADTPHAPESGRCWISSSPARSGPETSGSSADATPRRPARWPAGTDRTTRIAGPVTRETLLRWSMLRRFSGGKNTRRTGVSEIIAAVARSSNVGVSHHYCQEQFRWTLVRRQQTIDYRICEPGANRRPSRATRLV